MWESVKRKGKHFLYATTTLCRCRFLFYEVSIILHAVSVDVEKFNKNKLYDFIE